MAIDKFSGAPFNPLISLLTRASLEDTLSRFNEEVSHYTSDVIRERLKTRLGHVQVNTCPSEDGL